MNWKPDCTVEFNMENFNVRKLKLLQSIERLKKIIDDEVDWFIASYREEDPKRKLIAKTMFEEKRKERIRIAKEENEKYRW